MRCRAPTAGTRSRFGKMSDNAVRHFILEPAERDPDGVALIDGPTGAETTRAELADNVLKASSALADLGIQREQRVMMMMADRPAFLEVFWGAMAHGAVPVPVSTVSRLPLSSKLRLKIAPLGKVC